VLGIRCSKNWRGHNAKHEHDRVCSLDSAENELSMLGERASAQPKPNHEEGS
jgi:hypothetical protein